MTYSIASGCQDYLPIDVPFCRWSPSQGSVVNISNNSWGQGVMVRYIQHVTANESDSQFCGQLLQQLTP